MWNKRASLMLFVVTGVVILLLLTLLVYLLSLWNTNPAASTSWEQPVKEYLRLCMQRSGEEGVDQILAGGGYMINTDSLLPGFGSATLLFYNMLIPVYYDQTTGEYTLVAVFDTDPGKIENLGNAPCYETSGEVGSQYECDKREFFEQLQHFPFGGGAVGEYQYRELPRVSLYERDPPFPYEPKCTTEYPCEFSVEEQLELFMAEKMHSCVDEATTLFAERGIDLVYADEAMAENDARVIDVLIKDDGTTYRLTPLIARYDGEEKLIDNVLYTSPKPLKQLFTLAHGGSTDYVLGATGIIEAESRDPDFIVARDGQDFLENVLFLDPTLYSISVTPFEDKSTKVSLSYKGESSLDFLMINRKPFISQMVPAEMSMAGGLYVNVPDKTPDNVPSTIDCYDAATSSCHETTLGDVTASPEWNSIVNTVYHDANYCLFLDARDPDDEASGGEFRPGEDVSVESLELFDTFGDKVELIDGFTYDSATKKLCFGLRIHEGYQLEKEVLWPDSDQPVYAPNDNYLIYIEGFDIAVDLLVKVVSTGGTDFLKLHATAQYEYGSEGTGDGVVFVNNDPVYFDQAWPWLILPNIDRGPQDDMVYFYEPDDVKEKCKIDFTNRRNFSVDLIDTRFFPDKNLTHFNEYYPEIYKAIITVIQEDRGRSFGFDQCCPSYTLMTKFRDRGICAPELCCIQVPFLGHDIRFFEKGAWNRTTPAFTGDIVENACKLEQVYNELGGDFYPQYLNIFFAENEVMDFRENLEVLANGDAPNASNEVNRGLVQVLPLRFKPDVFDVWTGESYSGSFEDYFQSFAAMEQYDDGSQPPGQHWDFTWDDGDTWMINDKAQELMQLLDKYPNLFKEGWTWWDYREVINECDDGWTSRDRMTGDCIPEDLLPSLVGNVTDYQDIKLLDPYICENDYSTSDPNTGLWNPETSIHKGDHVEDTSALPSIQGFGDELGRCPNLYETMKMVMNLNAELNESDSCTKELCCFKPDHGRVFHWYTDVDPKIFEQYGSWVPEYGVPGTALKIDDPGEAPYKCSWDDACAKPTGDLTMCQSDMPAEGCTGVLSSHLDLANEYASGGPFRSLAPRTRVTNFQWFHRVMHGSGTVQKRAGDTMMPGDGSLQYTDGAGGNPCSITKMLHRCAYGEGIGFDATDLTSRGIDPAKVGLKPDGTRSCPDDITAYELMINGTCRIQDCCFEFAPYGWATSVGRPGGAHLGSYSAPCPLIPAIDPGNDDDVGEQDQDSETYTGTTPTSNTGCC